MFDVLPTMRRRGCSHVPARGGLSPMDAPVDLRSDAVTKPSQAMRRAMAEAEVGDDWFGDDPTVNRLQDLAADLTGKAAAVYLPTGTMCSQIAMHAFTGAGHLVACEPTAHVCAMEASSAAVLSRLPFPPIPPPSHELLSAAQVEDAPAPSPYNATAVDL